MYNAYFVLIYTTCIYIGVVMVVIVW